jgi:hypothetical protein
MLRRILGRNKLWEKKRASDLQQAKKSERLEESDTELEYQSKGAGGEPVGGRE